MGIKILTLLHCKGDAEDTLEQELKRLAEHSVQESGCLKYEYYYCTDRRCHYVIVESWQTEEALNRHKQSACYKHFMWIAPVLVEQPVEPVAITRLV